MRGSARLGQLGLGQAVEVRHGTLRLGWVGRAELRRSGRVWTRLGAVRPGKAVEAWTGEAWTGVDRSGQAVLVRTGTDRLGEFRLGAFRRSSSASACCIPESLGLAVSAWSGGAWFAKEGLGEAVGARLVPAWCGRAIRSEK